ncbi:hypothetical protein [Streptomyces liliifuscus]|uniref:Uncharacterized protein n=1 Tax=Streptomyces liliifuscus TaxID=2797636 RepID=A0A7T7KZQ6_9ACTN|nr:hypothetical protein [Streptomyces liliifuscus]QQM43804.1 hypothetical protein JEQ17_33405 [Streptomyces liliifuscus]
MGDWVVIAQYSSDVYRTEFICSGQETKEQALKALRAALHTYLPSKGIVEKRRRVYRFADQESYLVVIKGRLSEWECTLRVAELVSDSTDPAVAERARPEDGAAEPEDSPMQPEDGAVPLEDGAAQLEDGAAEASDGPQDRIPPGY